ncbi:DUF4232 domain-containing protein [Amycolatopsis sp. NPDC059027]|uniref:DUF4232 domain-containing protein n=1 Tax=unclassified Amycolatopsis TaxID=2618356 RepID=UPI00366BF1A7
MNITKKTIQRATMAIAAVAAVGALGACSTGNAAPAPQGSGGTGGGIGAAPNAGTAKDTSAQGGADGATGSQRTGAGKSTPGTPANCLNLNVAWLNPNPLNSESTQWKLPIVLTNKTNTTCVVRGFPGVRLNGEDGTTWDLVRTNDAITPVQLGPGERATADVTYSTAVALNPETGSGGGDPSGWHVASVSITPPNSTNTQTLPWVNPIGLVKQDGATHPGTYVGAVRRGE